MIVSESKIDFNFPERYHVVKFDDTLYYRDCFNVFPNSKAVDFVATSDKNFVMIEVKNCVGNEAQNRWRIFPNNQKRDTIPALSDLSDRDSLDIEVTQKVAMTLSALLGVYTNPKPYKKVSECEIIAKSLCDESIRNSVRKVVVILVLDGEFGSHTRKDNTIRLAIQNSLTTKLKWLNCIVLVTSSKELKNARLGIEASQSL